MITVWTTPQPQDLSDPTRVRALTAAAWPVLGVLLSGALLTWLGGTS